ncbi:MAG: carboxypeptidase regulatory-like domain-containing protein [Gemmatimonadota bacterium]
MRLIPAVGFAGIAFAVACQPSADQAATDQAAEGTGGGTRGTSVRAGRRGEVRGVVRDAETERPLDGAWISAGDLGADTDATGSYALTLLPPGPTKVRAYRRGFRAESVTVIVRAGDATTADFNLAPAPPPCCRLAGRWTVAFALDSAGLNARPSTRHLSGSVAFVAVDSDRAAESGETATATDSVGDTGRRPDMARSASATGRAAFDFAPLLGTGIDARVEELAGVVFAGDSVAITLIPRFGDWAIELLGRQEADTIRGDWFQRASCCGAYGTFVMTRDAAVP